MSKNKDFGKLQRFVEAALSNPTHPVYRLGLSHSPMLQHYAINVASLGAITPQQWFEENPVRTAQLEEVMRLCEEDEAEALAESEKKVVTGDKVAALESTVAEQTKQIERLLKLVEAQGKGTEGESDEADEAETDADESDKGDQAGADDEEKPFDED